MRARKLMRKLFLFFLLGVYFLPQILSTSFGKRALEHYLSKKLLADVALDSLSLHWLKPQDFYGVCYTRKQTKLSSKHVCVKAPLLFLLFSSHRPSSTFELNLGEVTSEIGENLDILLTLLKQKLRHKGTVRLLFCPMDVCVKKEEVIVERSKVLVEDSLEVCLFGSTNLKTKELKLTLGLPATALKKAFGIKHLRPDYVLHIPIQGNIDHLKINVKEVAAEVAALMLWQKTTATKHKEKNSPSR